MNITFSVLRSIMVAKSVPTVITLSNSPYNLPCNDCDVSSENFVLDRLIIPLLISFCILITCCLMLYSCSGEEFCLHGRQILLITGMITDWIGFHSVLLPLYTACFTDQALRSIKTLWKEQGLFPATLTGQAWSMTYLLRSRNVSS